MFPIRFKRPALLCMAMLTVVLSGCGLIQKVVDESKSVASAVFYKQIKILHLDFFSRSALNTDAYFHERRSLNNFHRDRVITFEQIAE